MPASIEWSQWLHDDATLGTRDFSVAFYGVALVSAAAAFVFARLPAGSGDVLRNVAQAGTRGRPERRPAGSAISPSAALAVSAAEPGRQNVEFGRIGPAGARLDMPNRREVALEGRQQRGLGSALQHLGQEEAARAQALRG